MKRQIILVLGFSILFTLSCFFPSVIGFSLECEGIYSNKSDSQPIGAVVIVDDEGDGDFVRIQDALNYSNPGDTIEVYSGTYYEHGVNMVKESITLQGIPYELGSGHDTGKPFIDGQGIEETILIKAGNIVIDSFRIENKGPSSNGILALYKESYNCVISNNDLFDSSAALIWCAGSNTKIFNNNISHNFIRQGIVLYEPGHHNTIISNVISDVVTGILCWNSNHNSITGNKISKCSRFGLDIAGSQYNTVKGNTFEDNTVGVHIYYGVGSWIKNNNLINNQIHAQFEYGIPPFWVLLNRWNGNYWGEPRSSPYPIWGTYFIFPWVQFDWFPAKEPNEIEV